MPASADMVMWDALPRISSSHIALSRNLLMNGESRPQHIDWERANHHFRAGIVTTDTRNSRSKANSWWRLANILSKTASRKILFMVWSPENIINIIELKLFWASRLFTMRSVCALTAHNSNIHLRIMIKWNNGRECVWQQSGAPTKLTPHARTHCFFWLAFCSNSISSCWNLNQKRMNWW